MNEQTDKDLQEYINLVHAELDGQKIDQEKIKTLVNKLLKDRTPRENPKKIARYEPTSEEIKQYLKEDNNTAKRQLDYLFFDSILKNFEDPMERFEVLLSMATKSLFTSSYNMRLAKELNRAFQEIKSSKNIKPEA